MSRETKVGMLVGLGVILLIGIIVSDQLSAAHKQVPAKQLTEMAASSQDGLVAHGDASAAMNPDNRPTAIPLPGEHQAVPTSSEVQPPAANSDPASKLVMGRPQGDGVKQTLGNTAGPVPVIPANNPIVTQADAGQTHIVKTGDSLYAIAKQYYKVPTTAKIALIRNANKANLTKGDGLKVGSKLVIPVEAAPAAATPSAPVTTASTPVAPAAPTPTASAARTDVFSQPASNSVTVEKGQTLGAIAAKYLGSAQRWNEIKALNKGIDPNNLKVGTKLTLPAAKSDAEAAGNKKSEPTASAAPVAPVGTPLAAHTAAASPLAPNLPARMSPSTPGMTATAAPAVLPAPATPIASVIKSPAL